MGLAIVASLPVLAVVILMALRGWSASRAGLAGWAVCLLVCPVFGAGLRVLAVSQGKAVLLAVYVLYIVWSALALFHVVDEAGALPAVAQTVGRLTADPMLQLLVLAWCFASFLQGVTGFGVPVAVVTPLLVALGFAPLQAVAAASLGHAWAVTFGSVATSLYAMLAVTGLDGSQVAPPSAALLGIICLGCGACVAHVHGGRRGVSHALPAILVLGLGMAGIQYALARVGLWTVAAAGGGLAGIGLSVPLARTARYRGPDGGAGQPAVRKAAWALSPYGLLLGLVIAAGLVPGLQAHLDRLTLAVRFPSTTTALGWANPAGAGRTLSVFGHPGALILCAALGGFGLFSATGWYQPGSARRVVRRTARAAAAPTAAIATLVGMAALMQDAGMTHALAALLATATGQAFPLAAPAIGALGAFVTGSNTNSNVLFASLQARTASLLGVNQLAILAAQNAGAATGSVFSPAKIVVGCSTAGMTGQEGAALRLTMRYGLVLVAAAGVIASVWTLR